MTSDGLRVRGGAAGVAVTTEALHGGAARVREVSLDLDAHTRELGRLVLDPALLVTAGLDPAGAGVVADSAAAATVGADGLIRTGAALLGFSASTGYAALRYELAETAAERALALGTQALAAPVLQPAIMAAGGGLLLAGAGWAGSRALGAVPAGITGAGGFRTDRWLEATGERLGADAQSGLTWLANHPDVTQHAVSTLPILLRSMGLVPEADGRPGAGVPELAVVATRLGPGVGLFKRGEVSTRIRSEGRAVQAPTSVAGALHEASALGANKEASAVKFIRQGDRWIAIPPATQDWSPVSGPNPADLGSNIAKLGGRAGGARADSTQALAGAMREVGIRPGDPVMIVGHSQAGITAVDLAGDPDLGTEFNIQVVLTAASPTGAHDVPAGVQVLSIENGDVVPQLDGVPNPDKAHVTTVRAHAPDLPGAPRGERAPGAFHGLAEYGVIAEQIDRSEHASIQAWREAAAPFLTGGQAEEILVEVTRTLPG